MKQSREAEDSYKRLFEDAPMGMVLRDWQGLRVTHANRAFCALIGYAEDELVGMSVRDLTHPEDLDMSLAQLQRLIADEEQNYRIEKRYLKKNGEILWASVTVSRVLDAAGKPQHLFGMVEDIGERKLAHEQQLAIAAAHRSSLVREVHHRIKNNLQSVAGLLGRELDGHTELHPRLAVAISQVYAIATVHGMQGARSNETILLCDTLAQICRNIVEQTKAAIQCRIEGESQGFLPVQIARDEAVPVALVLNELIHNAVKHTPPDAPAPTVSLESDGVSARVRIGNSAKAGGEFDFASGLGLNTGLRLVQSLMPIAGATLSYGGVGSGRVQAELSLTDPVVVATAENPMI